MGHKVARHKNTAKLKINTLLKMRKTAEYLSSDPDDLCFTLGASPLPSMRSGDKLQQQEPAECKHQINPLWPKHAAKYGQSCGPAGCNGHKGWEQSQASVGTRGEGLTPLPASLRNPFPHFMDQQLLPSPWDKGEHIQPRESLPLA